MGRISRSAHEDFCLTVSSNMIKKYLSGYISEHNGQTEAYRTSMTNKLRELDYIPSQEDILLVRRPTKIFISATLKLNMFPSKSLI
ncbi:hypothetical protein GH733_009151, partial [Mirounga leonina]